MQQQELERRRTARQAVALDALIVTSDASERVDCRILDINQFGCRLEVGAHAPADQFHLVDLISGVAYHARVMWRQPPLVGTRFVETWNLSSPNCPAFLVTARAERVLAQAASRGIRIAASNGKLCA